LVVSRKVPTSPNLAKLTMKNDYYTYAYLREDGTPYYIGKGRGRRAFIKSGRAVPCPPKNRILFLKRNLTEEEAFRHEVYMIAVLGRKTLGTGTLYNFTDGGEGVSNPSPSTRQKMRERKLGRKLDDATRQKMSESSATKGKKRPEEVREKIKRTKKSNPHKFTEDQRRKMSEAAKRRPPISEETRRRRSESMKRVCAERGKIR